MIDILGRSIPVCFYSYLSKFSDPSCVNYLFPQNTFNARNKSQAFQWTVEFEFMQWIFEWRTTYGQDGMAGTRTREDLTLEFSGWYLFDATSHDVNFVTFVKLMTKLRTCREIQPFQVAVVRLSTRTVRTRRRNMERFGGGWHFCHEWEMAFTLLSIADLHKQVTGEFLAFTLACLMMTMMGSVVR